MSDDLREIVEDLRDHVLDLEDELAEVKAERNDLRERVAELENQASVSMENGDVETIEVEDPDGLKYPLGKVVTRHTEKLDDIDDRVYDIEVGEIDPGQIVAESGNTSVENLLPIHQQYLTTQHVEPEEHGLSNNQEIAARLFPHFADAADPTGGKMTLASGKVRVIIEREIDSPDLRGRLDVKNPNPNTIRRVMNFIGKFGGDVLEFSDDGKANTIEADYDEWRDYEENVMESFGQVDADPASTNQPVATDGGGL